MEGMGRKGEVKLTTEVQDSQEVRVKIKIPRAHSKKQDEFIRCIAKRQMIKAGRRFGKTVGAAIKAVRGFMGVCSACIGEGCLGCDNTGKVRLQRVLYAAPTAEQVGKFWYEVTKALSEGIEVGSFKKDETEHIIEVSGTEVRIKAKTAWNANTLRGDFADLLILEEFQMMNEDAWEEVGQPMLLDNNGTAVFIFTPPSLKSEGISKAKDPRHASKMFQKASEDTSGRWKTFHFTSYDNPTLSAEALATLAQDMSQDAYRREILALDDELETSWLVYGKFDDTLCKIKRFPIPDNWPVFTGHDFGEANHASLFVAQVRLPLPPQAPGYLRIGDYVAFAEYAPGAGSSAERHIENYKDIMGRKDGGTLRLKLERAVGGNVTTEEQTRQLYRRLGWNIMAPELTRVKLQLDRALAIVEQNQFYVFEDLHQLLGQLHDCMWEIDPQTKKPLDKIKDEAKYHLLSAFRYLCTVLIPKQVLRARVPQVWNM